MTFRSTIFYSSNQRHAVSTAAAIYNPAAVHFPTDSDYYAGTNNVGLGSLGTVCAVFRLAGLTDANQRLIFGRAPLSFAGGWYLATAVNGAGNANKLAFVYRDGSGVVKSPDYTFVAGDVGKCFVVHGTYESGAVRIYIQGVEQDSGTAGTAPGDAGASAGLRVGNIQGLAGLNNPYIDPIALITSTASISATDILAHATAIINSRAETIPALTSEVERYIAEDIFPSGPLTTWPDRDTASSVDLTKAGNPTVYRV